MSMWPGLEVWTPQWGILSIPGRLQVSALGTQRRPGPARPPSRPLFQQHQVGGDQVVGQPVLIQLLDIISQPRSGSMD